MMGPVFGEDPVPAPAARRGLRDVVRQDVRATRRPRPATRPSCACGSTPTCATLLPSVHVPTAVLYKADDPDPWTRDGAAYLAERIPGARPGGGIPGAAVTSPGWRSPNPWSRPWSTSSHSVREEEVALDRVLATVLFTDVVGSTQTGGRAGRRSAGSELLERHGATCASAACPLPRQRGQDHGRRLPGDLRRAGAGGALRAGHLRGGAGPSASRCGPAATPARSS